MPISDIFHLNQIKGDLENTRQELNSCKSVFAETEKMDFLEFKKEIAGFDKFKSDN